MAIPLKQLNRPATVRPDAVPAAVPAVEWPTVLPFAAAAALLLVLAWPMLRWWAWEWTRPESYYAHAPLIPLLAGLMVWHRRRAWQGIGPRPCPAALLVLVPALALLVWALKVQAQAVMSAAFLLSVVSAVWLALGTAFVRAGRFGLLFLWLMAPLPGPLLNEATQGLQMTSTCLADRLLHLMTFHTTLQGNVITMDNFSLFVDVPCSGFKLLLALLTFSAAFAYLVDGAPMRRVTLFAFSLPLALLVNGVRIALVGVAGECAGAHAAAVFHDWSGALTLILGFVALFSLAKRLGCRTFAGWAIF